MESVRCQRIVQPTLSIILLRVAEMFVITAIMARRDESAIGHKYCVLFKEIYRTSIGLRLRFARVFVEDFKLTHCI